MVVQILTPIHITKHNWSYNQFNEGMSLIYSIYNLKNGSGEMSTRTISSRQSLANKLLAKKTSLVGTINKARMELPPSVQNKAPAHQQYSTTVLKNEC